MHCDAVALALQHVLTIDDPTQMPDEASQLAGSDAPSLDLGLLAELNRPDGE